MMNILIAIILLFVSTFVHECMHLFPARYFGKKSYFKLVSSKEKKTIGIFGWLPGVHTENVKDIKEIRWISLSPIPFGFVFYSLIFIVATYPVVVGSTKIWWWVLLCISCGFITTYVTSRSDIKYYERMKNPGDLV